MLKLHSEIKRKVIKYALIAIKVVLYALLLCLVFHVIGHFALRQNAFGGIFNDYSNDSSSIGVNHNTDAISETLDIISQRYYKEINEKEVNEAAIKGILRSLDRYSDYFSPEEMKAMEDYSVIPQDYMGIGVSYVKFGPFAKIVSVLDDTSAKSEGLKRGDLIISVNRKTIADLSISEINAMISSSPKNVELGIVRYNLSNGVRASFYKTIAKGKIKHTLTTKIVNGIAIFKLQTINESSYNELRTAVVKYVSSKDGTNKETAGIILDLRNNPGGFLDEAIDISSLFLNDYAQIVSVTPKQSGKSVIFSSDATKDVTNGMRLAVIINRNSASAAEIIAAALQENKRAIVVGEKSFGKGSVQEIIPLMNIEGAGIKITVANYYTPNNNKIDGIGVSPDIYIKDKDADEVDEIVSLDSMNVKTNCDQSKKIANGSVGDEANNTKDESTTESQNAIKPNVKNDKAKSVDKSTDKSVSKSVVKQTSGGGAKNVTSSAVKTKSKAVTVSKQQVKTAVTPQKDSAAVSDKDEDEILKNVISILTSKDAI